MPRAPHTQAFALLLTACTPARVAPPRVAVHIDNDSDTMICDVFMRPSTEAAAGWGVDWLDRHQSVEPGAVRTFRLAPGKTWDVRVVSCVGDETIVAKSRQIETDITLRVRGPSAPR